jgi:hypothetical protein
VNSTATISEAANDLNDVFIIIVFSRIDNNNYCYG